MVETSFFDPALATAITLGMTVVALGLVQSTGLARRWLAITPAAVGVPSIVSKPDSGR